MSPKRFWNLLLLSFQAWRSDRADRLAAALAYYTAFSLAPVLLLVIAMAGLFLGEEAARGELFSQIHGLIGAQGAAAVEAMVERSGDRGDGTWATWLSLALLAFGASSVFLHLKESLNIIWNVEDKAPSGGLIRAISSRIISFSMIPVIGFLLLVSLAVTTALAYFSNVLEGVWQNWLPLASLLNFVFSFGIITLLFALIYKILPDVAVPWSDVWVGSAATAGLFTLGKWAIGLYLGNSDIASVYGAAGSFVVLLVWIYYSAQILFLGAEFTQVYAHRYGSKMTPLGDTNFGGGKVTKKAA